jgi:hypothetical protein
MAQTQLIQWITLPNGVAEDGRLKLSVFVAPRLRSNKGLSLVEFPDFVNWAATVGPGGVQFEIERPDGTRLTPEVVSAAPDTDLWKLLFDEETPLRPFVFDDFADRPLVSFPVIALLNYFKDKYAQLAAQSVDDLPLTRTLDGQEGEGQASLEKLFEEILEHHGGSGVFRGDPASEQLAQRIGAYLESARAKAQARRASFPLQDQERIDPFWETPPGPAGHLYQAQTFHRRARLKPVDFPGDSDEATRHFAERVDFHQMLSALADYPVLLRSLGLVFDLLLPADALPIDPVGAAPRGLRTRAAFHSAFPERTNPPQTTWTLSVSPETDYLNTEVNGTRLFVASPRNGLNDSTYRLMQLDPAQFTLVQVDVDGLALKVSGLLSTVRRQLDNPNRPIEEPGRSGTPVVRTGGLALIHTGRADALHENFYQARRSNHDLETNVLNPAPLAAEDLTRGVRLDVYDDESRSWHSLHARRGAYEFLRDPARRLEGVVDEGLFQVALAGDVDTPGAPPDPDGELYAHESLVTWDGWSLSVPRPGAKVEQEPIPPQAGHGVTPLPLAAEFSVEGGTLPRLRFGRGYSLRLRAVDLAGNSLTLQEADDLLDLLRDQALPGVHPVTSAGQHTTYRRFEPIPPPELVARRRFGEGEGLERLVIRSDFDLSSADYPAAFANVYPTVEPSSGDPYVAFCDRFVAAPKASLQLYEMHGMFDGWHDAARAQGMDDWKRAVLTSYDIASRESRSFRDDEGAEFVETAPPELPDETGVVVKHGYAVIDSDSVALPYLADPLSSGAVLRFSGRPGEPDTAIVVRFDADSRPFRLRLEEGNAPPRYDPITGVLTVHLARGRMAYGRLNSLFENDPKLLGLVGWCEEVLAPVPEQFDNVLRAIEESRHWMVTPWRDLTFVHAVQRPLEAPEFELTNLLQGHSFSEENILARGQARTMAYLSGVVQLDGPSTAQIDIVARWREPQDDPVSGPPLQGEEMLQFKKTVMALGIPESGQSYQPRIQAYLSLEDDRLVLFNSRVDEVTAEAMRLDLEQQIGAPGSESEKDSLRKAVVQLGQLQPHEFGDTRYRKVDYHMIAASRFREYFALPVGEVPENVSRAGSVVTVHVLSTAAPAKPSVAHVVPLMRWEETGDLESAERTSTRYGAGVRVWLERPWFSSGEGELLAVVFGSAIHSPHDPLYPYVTLWGQDPIHASALPPGPGLTSFRDARVVKGLTLRENTGLRVNVALFEPVYDCVRDRWFCDIELDTAAAYFPFVRLALARYQRMSIPGMELSPVVLADITQTFPDRSLSLVRDANDVSSLHLTLRGPAPTARRAPDGSTVAGTNLVTAQVEQQEAGFGDDTLGWQMLGEETVLTGTVEAGSQAVWAGVVPLPAHNAGTLRLVVQEFEVHPGDDAAGGLSEVRRLVHADVQTL